MSKWTWASSKLALKKLKQHNCFFLAVSLNILGRILLKKIPKYIAKLVRWKNDNNANVSNIPWMDFKPLAGFAKILFWLPKKVRAIHIYIYIYIFIYICVICICTKLISVLYSTNYNLIAPIHSTTTSIFTVYSHRWRNIFPPQKAYANQESIKTGFKQSNF